MSKFILRGILAGIIMLILSTLYSFAVEAIFPFIGTEYGNTNIYRAFSDPLMNLFWLYPFVLGIALSWFWDRIKSLLKVANPYIKGLNFGLEYWVVATVPGMLITFASFKVSLFMILIWSISGLIQAIAAGMIFAKTK